MQLSRSFPQVLITAFTLAGCATITKGIHERIEVVSDPPGASAYTDIPKSRDDLSLGYIGCAPTPCSFSLPRRREAVLEINAPGFAPLEVGIISDHRKERAYREGKKAATKAGLPGNTALGLGATLATYGIGSLEAGAIVIPATGAGLVMAGSIIYTTTASYTLAANTTDTITGADHSLYPSAIGVRLSTDAHDYPPDPNVAGVRQRRSRPSPKPLPDYSLKGPS